MARPKEAKTLRAETCESLLNQLKAKDLEEKIYLDLVDQYMTFYDDLTLINEAIIDLKSQENMSFRSYTDMVSEKRRISKEMRDILTFLGLKPPEGKGGATIAPL